MITRLTGLLEDVSPNRAVVSPDGGVAGGTAGGAGGGVAYEVLVPSYLSDRLASRRGQQVTLHTLQYLEAQGQGTSMIPRLLGFLAVEERRFFELMTSVKGLGSRKALRAMAAEPSVIAMAIASGDAKALQRLPEIGKRLAETMIVDLKDKVSPFLAGRVVEMKGAAPSAPVQAGPATEAVDALVTLGESRADAERMVQRVLSRNGELDTTESILSAALAAR